jgi:hypothetical protein
MIQRIQSLFLLAATVLFVIFIFHPVSSLYISGDTAAEFFAYGLMSDSETPEMLYNTFPIIVLAIITTILTVLTIFVYKNRTIQMRICVYNILITLGLIISIFIYYYLIRKHFEVSKHAFSYSVLLPVVNVILLFQAFRGIRRDDLLLKSYNRLRD